MRTTPVRSPPGRGHGYRSGVDLGITIHLTDRCVDVRDLASEAEARGFSSLYVPEHTHIPSSQATPVPMGGDLPVDVYPRSLDPMAALTAAAAVTSTIRIGTGVSLVAQHHPITLAKAAATIDLLSGGRFVMGVGYGWNREEMAHHGVDYATRRARVRETMLAVRQLWTVEEAEFHGEYVDFGPSWSWPKPLQQPGPPVLIGGSPGPTLIGHVAEYADGWMPIGGAGVRAALADLRAACQDRGRDPAEVTVIPFGTVPDEGKLDYYAGLGISEVVLRVPSAPRDEVLGVLDDYARFVG